MSSPSSSRFPLARWLWLVALAALLVGVYWLLTRDTASTTTPPRFGSLFADAPAVRVVPVTRGELSVQVKSIGTVTPLNAVTVRARVGGVIQSLPFEEGAAVKRGDLLAVIDPAPYQANLAQAEGQLLQNQAQLANAEQDLALYRSLYEQDSIARQQLTQQEATVNQLRGAIKANQGQIADARLQLQWTRVEAPIDGRLGLRRVDVGNLVAANDADGIVTIMQMSPISVLFTVPETRLQAVREAFRQGPLAVQAYGRDDTTLLASGELVTLDNQIDVATGTLRLRARFDNGDEALYPNQFVNVRLQVATLADVLTVPVDTVQFGKDGAFVYVIREGQAWLRPVQVGATDASQAQILDGLEEGEQVVLEGVDALRDGRPVTLVDESGQVIAPPPAATGEDGRAPAGTPRAGAPGARARGPQ